jgi:hypothetical protein
MGDYHQNLNLFLKREADEILNGKGLIDILKSFGTPHIQGSYELDLMTWRDLDIYLQVDNIKEKDFFDLGSQICTLLAPIKMSYRNELIAKTKNLPTGLYWGVYLGNERADAWKIDIWAVNPSECQRLINFCSEIKKKLTPDFVFSILNIKSLCWKDPEYRRSYGSMDIYNSVIENNVKDIKGFRDYLKVSE